MGHFLRNKVVTVFPSLLLFVLLSSFECAKSLAITREKSAQSDGNNDTHPICGEVKTAAGINVILREGMSLTADEFENIHLGKLQNAVFSLPTNNSAIQVCGYTSWVAVINQNKTGNMSYYGDCLVFEDDGVPSDEIFNDNYNTSSISCGFYKNRSECTFSCTDRYKQLNKTWSGDQCAVLYQEAHCNSCYFEPVSLSNNQNYTVDLAHNIRTLVVRDQCEVTLNVPGLQKMPEVGNITHTFTYGGMPSEFNIPSAFQAEREHFYCKCGVPTPTTTPLPYPSTTSTEKPPRPGNPTVVTIVIALICQNPTS